MKMPRTLVPAGITVGSLFLMIALIVSLFVMMSINRNSALDDAYITYIYAQNLADGFGLRYNATDLSPTEGSSSLLQTLLVAGAAKAGLDPLLFSRALNIGIFALGALLLTIYLRKPTRTGIAVTLPVTAITCFIYLYMPETHGHMAKGLETIMVFYLHAALFLWAIYVGSATGRLSISTSLVGAFLATLLILTRPEGFLLAFGTLGAIGLARLVVSTPGNIMDPLRNLLPLALGLGLCLAGYFAWKISYFGDIYPTSYWVKSNNNIFGSNGDLLPGLPDIATFLIFRWLPIAAGVFALLWLSGATREMKICTILILPSLAIVLLYSRAIHEAAGGFRYGYPMLAPLFITGALGLALYIRQAPWLRASFCLSSIFVVGLLGIYPYEDSYIKILKRPVAATTDWVDHTPELPGLTPLALDMTETGLGGDASILLSAAGFIPYESGFQAIDWLGLNDEQMSGKYPMSVEEARAHLDARAPDMAMSVFPPASPGATSYHDDPAFNSRSVQATIRGRGVRLFKYWDQDLVNQMIWSNMAWYRDHTDYAACYELLRTWVVFTYVSKTSPHYDQLMDKFSNSPRQGCTRYDMEWMYNIDPREAN